MGKDNAVDEITDRIVAFYTGQREMLEDQARICLNLENKKIPEAFKIIAENKEPKKTLEVLTKLTEMSEYFRYKDKKDILYREQLGQLMAAELDERTISAFFESSITRGEDEAAIHTYPHIIPFVNGILQAGTSEDTRTSKIKAVIDGCIKNNSFNYYFHSCLFPDLVERVGKESGRYMIRVFEEKYSLKEGEESHDLTRMKELFKKTHNEKY